MSGIKLTAIVSALTLTLSSASVIAAQQPVKKHHHHHHCHTGYKGEQTSYVAHKRHHCTAHHPQRHYTDYMVPHSYNSEPAYKGEYKDAQMAVGTPVLIPETTHRFEVTFDPMLLKAGATNLNYVIYNNELPVQSPKWYEQELKPKYTFAFLLSGRYMFPQSRDITLDWTHMKSTNTSSSVAAPNANFFLGPDYQIGPEGTVVRNASGSVDFNYDVINLNAGQTISLGNNAALHLFGGLSEGLLRQEVQSTYSGTTAAPFAGAFSMYQYTKANFKGLGPRLGIDFDYTSDYGIGFVGEAAGSALVGSTYSKVGFVGNSPELVSIFGQTNNEQVITDQQVMQVVPGFDAKLGINYKHVVGNNMFLTVGAGYQAAVYINAISSYTPDRLVTGEALSTGGIFVDTMAHRLSNYSVQGPYLNFSLKF